MLNSQTTFSPPKPYSIDRLLDLIVAGRIQAPEFQRPFVWTDFDVKALFESIYMEFPIGEILLWKTNNRDIKRQAKDQSILPVQDFTYPVYFVIDGLQRLSTLYATLIHPDHINNPAFNIVFDLERQSFHKDSSERIVLPRIRLSEIFLDERYKELYTRVIEHQDQAILFPSFMKLYKAIIRYTIPVTILHDSEITDAVEIFLRINVRGKDLKSSDRRRAKQWRKRRQQ